MRMAITVAIHLRKSTPHKLANDTIKPEEQETEV